MSVLFSFSLYFLSFMPLWLSVLFIDIKSIADGERYVCTEWLAIGSIILGSVLSIYFLLRQINKDTFEGTSEYIIKSAQEEKTITAEFLLSHILPLFCFDFTIWHEVVLFLWFFITLGFLSIRHNYFCVNVVLELMNYRFYQCVLENEDNIKIATTVISKKRMNIRTGEQARLRELNDDYFIEV